MRRVALPDDPYGSLLIERVRAIILKDRYTAQLKATVVAEVRRDKVAYLHANVLPQLTTIAADELTLFDDVGGDFPTSEFDELHAALHAQVEPRYETSLEALLEAHVGPVREKVDALRAKVESVVASVNAEAQRVHLPLDLAPFHASVHAEILAARYAADLPGTVRAQLRTAKVAFLREHLLPRLTALVAEQLTLFAGEGGAFPSDEFETLRAQCFGAIEAQYAHELDGLIELFLGPVRALVDALREKLSSVRPSVEAQAARVAYEEDLTELSAGVHATLLTARYTADLEGIVAARLRTAKLAFLHANVRPRHTALVAEQLTLFAGEGGAFPSDEFEVLYDAVRVRIERQWELHIDAMIEGSLAPVREAVDALRAQYEGVDAAVDAEMARAHLAPSEAGKGLGTSFSAIREAECERVRARILAARYRADLARTVADEVRDDKIGYLREHLPALALGVVNAQLLLCTWRRRRLRWRRCESPAYETLTGDGAAETRCANGCVSEMRTGDDRVVAEAVPPAAPPTSPFVSAARPPTLDDAAAAASEAEPRLVQLP